MVHGLGIRAGGGGDAGVDGLLKLLHDYDEVKHKYHVKKVLTPAQAKKFKKKYREERNRHVFLPDSNKLIFRTVGKGNRRRVVALQRNIKLHPTLTAEEKRQNRPPKGHKLETYEKEGNPRYFGDNPLIENKPVLHKEKPVAGKQRDVLTDKSVI